MDAGVRSPAAGVPVTSQLPPRSPTYGPVNPPLGGPLAGEPFRLDGAPSAAARGSDACAIARLPEEILVQVMSHVGAAELRTLHLVCRRFHALLRDETCWRLAVERQFGGLPVRRLSRSWRVEYLYRTQHMRDWRGGRCATLQYEPRIGVLHDVLVDFDANKVLSANFDRGVVALSDSLTGKVAKEKLHAGPAREPEAILRTALSANRIAMARTSGAVVVLHGFRDRLASCQWRELPRLAGHNGPIVGMAWLPGAAHILLTAGVDGDVRVWDTQTGSLAGVLSGDGIALTCLAVDGRVRVAAGREDGHVTIWAADVASLCASRSSGALPTADAPRAFLLQPTRTISVKTGAVHTVLLDEASTTLLVLGHGSTSVAHVDGARGRVLALLESEDRQVPLTCVDWVRAGSRGGPYGGPPPGSRAGSQASLLDLPLASNAPTTPSPPPPHAGGATGPTVVNVVDSKHIVISPSSDPSPPPALVHAGPWTVVAGDGNGRIWRWTLPIWRSASSDNSSPVALPPIRNSNDGAGERLVAVRVDACKTISLSCSGHVRVHEAISLAIVRTLRVRLLRNAQQPVGAAGLDFGNALVAPQGSPQELDARFLFATEYRLAATIAGQIKVWDFRGSATAPYGGRRPRRSGAPGKGGSHVAPTAYAAPRNRRSSSKRLSSVIAAPGGASAAASPMVRELREELWDLEMEMEQEEAYRRRQERLQGRFLAGQRNGARAGPSGSWSESQVLQYALNLSREHHERREGQQRRESELESEALAAATAASASLAGGRSPPPPVGSFEDSRLDGDHGPSSRRGSVSALAAGVSSSSSSASLSSSVGSSLAVPSSSLPSEFHPPPAATGASAEASAPRAVAVPAAGRWGGSPRASGGRGEPAEDTDDSSDGDDGATFEFSPSTRRYFSTSWRSSSSQHSQQSWCSEKVRVASRSEFDTARGLGSPDAARSVSSQRLRGSGDAARDMDEDEELQYVLELSRTDR